MWKKTLVAIAVFFYLGTVKDFTVAQEVPPSPEVGIAEKLGQFIPMDASFTNEEGQRVTVLLHHPWLLFPAIPVFLVVIAFNFMGDALRDAADPYS